MPKTATYTGWTDVREVSARDVKDLVEDHKMIRFPRNQPVEVSDELAQALQDGRFNGRFEIGEVDKSSDPDVPVLTDDNNSDIVSETDGEAVTAPPTGSTRRASSRGR